LNRAISADDLVTTYRVIRLSEVFSDAIFRVVVILADSARVARFLCDVAAVECGSPAALRHSYVTSSPAETSYGHDVEYTCQRGYWFSHQVFSRLSTCDEHGNWTYVTSCVREFSTDRLITSAEKEVTSLVRSVCLFVCLSVGLLANL